MSNTDILSSVCMGWLVKLEIYLLLLLTVFQRLNATANIIYSK